MEFLQESYMKIQLNSKEKALWNSSFLSLCEYTVTENVNSYFQKSVEKARDNIINTIYSSIELLSPWFYSVDTWL